jgi:hypothetical protein
MPIKPKKNQMERNMKFQRKLLEDFRNKILSYEDASIYTILFDLVEGSGLEEVQMMLDDLKSDLQAVDK